MMNALMLHLTESSINREKERKLIDMCSQLLTDRSISVLNESLCDIGRFVDSSNIFAHLNCLDKCQ